MASKKTEPVIEAAAHWNAGNALEAGRVVFENLAPSAQPEWAARLLRLVLKRVDFSSQIIDRILSIAEDPDEWPKARRAFSKIRDTTLRLDALQERRQLTAKEDDLLCVLQMAELLAKVTYNATDPPDRFDADSGWWMAACLRGFVDSMHDDVFAKEAWEGVIATPSLT